MGRRPGVTIHCPLNAEIKPITQGGPACELCSALQTMSKKMIEMEKEYNRLPAVIEFKRLQKEFSELDKSHRKCAGCGLCFGGAHLAEVFSRHGGKDYCQYCTVKIKKIGITAFVAEQNIYNSEDDSNIVIKKKPYMQNKMDGILS
jgi:hypothetical protein